MLLYQYAGAAEVVRGLEFKNRVVQNPKSEARNPKYAAGTVFSFFGLLFATGFRLGAGGFFGGLLRLGRPGGLSFAEDRVIAFREFLGFRQADSHDAHVANLPRN
jgi:hypothetical protein